MYSIKCPYYNKKFSSLDELVNDVIENGVDVNHEVTFNDEGIGEHLINFIQF
jgi:hypothetical protein